MQPITDADVEITEDSPPWTCIYCGSMWPKDEPVKVLQDHVLVCNAHPAARFVNALKRIADHGRDCSCGASRSIALEALNATEA